MADGLLVTTAFGTIKTANIYAQKIFGYDEKELICQVNHTVLRFQLIVS